MDCWQVCAAIGACTPSEVSRLQDGYEALRQLTLALRPASNNRGLALMAALTSWAQFAMNQPLQPQLKLEDALEEARRAGTTIPDQLKQALLLKCEWPIAPSSESGYSGYNFFQGLA